jgi:hypothetical protein
VNGNPATTLQEPANQWSCPNRNPTVVQKAKFHRASQWAVSLARCAGSSVPKQISQDERIPRAGMPKGDQQGGFSGLVRLEGFGQTVGCIPIAYLQPLGAEHQG